MKVADANKKSAFTICEALNCYEAATKSIIVSIGKFGTIELHLCHECAVTKFTTTSPQDTILKKNGYTGQKAPLNQPVGDYCE